MKKSILATAIAASVLLSGCELGEEQIKCNDDYVLETVKELISQEARHKFFQVTMDKVKVSMPMQVQYDETTKVLVCSASMETIVHQGQIAFQVQDYGDTYDVEVRF